MIPYTIILPTIYGQVLVNRNDINQTEHLLKHGRAVDHNEIVAVMQFIEPESTAVDVGACFGIWSLAFAQRAKAVYTFEPQRALYNSICGTLALNSIENVFTFNWAVGSSKGTAEIPKPDYHKRFQFGGIPLTSSPAKFDFGEVEYESVHVTTLDSLKFSNLSLIKVDAEGLDLDVIYGSENTIKEHRPAVYFETLYLEEKDFLDFFSPLNYTCVKNNDNMLAFPNEKFYLVSDNEGKPTVHRRNVDN